MAARESERRYARSEARALEGITVGVKDDQQIAGKITTYGSVLFQDYRATENSPLVDKLAEAGAVVSIQTTVPEMMFHAATWSYLWGATRNPWNLHAHPVGLLGDRPPRWPPDFARWPQDRTWAARSGSRPPFAVCMDSSRPLLVSR